MRHDLEVGSRYRGAGRGVEVLAIDLLEKVLYIQQLSHK